METCLESLKGMESKPSSTAASPSPDTLADCAGALDQLKVELDDIRDRVALLETEEKLQDCSAKQVLEHPDKKQFLGRHGRAVFLIHEGEHLKMNDWGYLVHGKRLWHDSLFILYMNYRDGTYIIKSLRNGKFLQLHIDGKLFFGNYDDPEKFYIEKSDLNGPFTLCCEGKDVTFHLDDHHYNGLQRGRLDGLSIVTLEESGYLPEGMSDARIPLGVEIVLAGKHGLNLKNGEEGKAVCVNNVKMYWERFVILPSGGGTDSFVLMSTKDGTYLQQHDNTSEAIFWREKTGYNSHWLHIEAYPGDRSRLVFHDTGNVVRTYCNHQVRCEDSTGGDWSKWTIVWRSDGLH